MLWLFVVVVGTAFAAVAISILFNTYRSYAIAKPIGLPTRITFSSPMNPLFQIAGKSIREWCRIMPWPLSGFGKYSYYGWGYDDCKDHDKLGPVWIDSSSWGNNLIVADPDALLFILTKWRTFIKIPGIQAMAVLGPNLDTV